MARPLHMESHGQTPWFPRNARKGRTSRTRGPIHTLVETVVLLVRDRIPQCCLPHHRQMKLCVRKKRDSGDRKEPAIHEQTSFRRYFRLEVVGDIRKRIMSIGEAVLEHGYT